jgi:hypothetical protein
MGVFSWTLLIFPEWFYGIGNYLFLLNLYPPITHDNIYLSFHTLHYAENLSCWNSAVGNLRASRKNLSSCKNSLRQAQNMFQGVLRIRYSALLLKDQNVSQLSKEDLLFAAFNVYHFGGFNNKIMASILWEVLSLCPGGLD